MKEKTPRMLLRMLLLLLVCMLSALSVIGTPAGVTYTSYSNATGTPAAATIRNESSGGGYIYTVDLNATQIDTRWKAYIGNVTGKLTLEDSNGYVIYDWTVSAATEGEVYATRSSSTVNWTNISCAQNGQVNTEGTTLSQTSTDDNLTVTFVNDTHSAFIVGVTVFATDACGYTTNTYIGNVSQRNSFDEVLLFDGSRMVYTTVINDSTTGYNADTYDFQMLLPENGADGWDSSTAYYFYVELS